MAGDSFGKLFQVHNWGESHGTSIGAVITGCPPKIALTEDDFTLDLGRRRPGQSSITSPRREADNVKILSGVFKGYTTGTPIHLLMYNKDVQKKDYDKLKDLYRPSHADFTYEKKYGLRDPYGGGRSSARLLAANVAAGCIAKKILRQEGVTILAYVRSIHTVALEKNAEALENVTLQDIEATPVRCPDKHVAQKMIERIQAAKREGDTLGGVIECVIHSCPLGLGEPVYDKLEADLAKACLLINACKGFEIGSGFEGTRMKGSEHNDIFTLMKDPKSRDEAIVTKTNFSGGLQGGISNGMPIILRAAFKPVSTLAMQQETLSRDSQTMAYTAQGRHDPCVLPRAVPIVEAMVALVLCDHLLRYRAYQSPSLPS